MIMVTGGTFQGKTAYTMRKFGLAESDIADGADASFEKLKTARCITNYHLLVKHLGDDCIGFTEELCRTNPEAIIIIDERRCGCIIAANSEKVLRIVCGIPAIIKGENE